jgi:catechol-2,3-dioxygenase
MNHLDNKTITIILTDPEGNETKIWPEKPKSAYHYKMHLYPKLSPPTEEERILINSGLSPIPKRSIVKRISMKFRDHCPW